MKKPGGIVVASSVLIASAAALAVGYASWSGDGPGEYLAWVQQGKAANSEAVRGTAMDVATEAAAPPPVVEPPPPPLVVTVPAVRAPAAWLQSGAQVPADGAALARQLQRELQRVGCYDGGIDGVWAPATRGAMKAFTEAVNAALPSDEPDTILLSLVQGHQGKACGRTCQDGQGIARDGRCLPSAILARAPRKPAAPAAVFGRDKASPSAPATVVAGPPPPAPPADGRVPPAGSNADISPATAIDGNGETAVVAVPGLLAAPAARPQRRTTAKPPARSNVGWGLFRQFERSGS